MTNSVLVLNGNVSYVTSARRALALIESNKAVVLEKSDKKVHSPSVSIAIPSVITITSFHNVPRRGAMWSKVGVFERDGYTCQYCGVKLTKSGKGPMAATLDHVISQAKLKKAGVNPNTWVNTVCACVKCNRRKADRDMDAAGMHLISPISPKTPRTSYLRFKGKIPDAWTKYLEIK